MFYLIVSCNLRGDVKFYLSTKDQNRTELNYDNLDAVDVENPTVFLIHGWTKSCNDSWVCESTAELLQQGDCNVIAVDYTPISQLDYFSAIRDAKYVGKYFISNTKSVFWGYEKLRSKGADRSPRIPLKL